MRIVNATKTNQTFILSTGYQISIKPGSISEVFLGDDTIVRSILRSGLSCEEVAIVVGSADEYEICRRAIPAGMNQVSNSGSVVNYVYTDEEKAKAKLLEGKDFTPKLASANAILDMQLVIDKKDEEITKLKKKIKEYKVETEQAKASLDPLQKANEELNKRLIKANSDVDETNETNISLREKIKEVNEQNKGLLELKTGLEKIISEKNETIAGLNKNLDILKDEGKKCLDKNIEMSNILNDLVKTYNLEEVEKGKWRIKEEKKSEQK